MLSLIICLHISEFSHTDWCLFFCRLKVNHDSHEFILVLGIVANRDCHTRLRLAKSTAIGKISVREEMLKVYKFPCMPSIFFIKKCEKTAFGKTDRNCLVFANSRWEMLLKAIGQPLGTAKRV
jgi:hypothetical protein